MGWLVVLPSLIKQHGGNGHDRLIAVTACDDEEVGEAVVAGVLHSDLVVMMMYIIRLESDESNIHSLMMGCLPFRSSSSISD